MTDVNQEQQSTNDSAAGSNNADQRFTQADIDRIVADRLKRQEEALTKKHLEKLGVADFESAATTLKEAKTRQEAEMTELDKLRAQITDLANKNAAHLNQIEAMNRQRLTDARDSAIKAALTAARASNPDRVLTLLNAERATEVAATMAETGAIDAKSVSALVATAQKEYAEFFRANSPGSPSNAGGTPPTVDQERIKAALAQRKRVTF